MRKQTDYAFRQIEYSSINPEQSSPVWSAWVKENYLDRGWEILSATVTKAEANSVFVALVFVKWEEVADEVRAKSK
jgi:hypothetical protein